MIRWGEQDILLWLVALLPLLLITGLMIKRREKLLAKMAGKSLWGAMLPGYSFNARFMEKMMGVKEKFELDDIVQKSKFKDFFRIIYMIYNILKNSITLEAQKRKFTRFFFWFVWQSNYFH